MKKMNNVRYFEVPTTVSRHEQNMNLGHHNIIMMRLTKNSNAFNKISQKYSGNRLDIEAYKCFHEHLLAGYNIMNHLSELIRDYFDKSDVTIVYCPLGNDQYRISLYDDKFTSTIKIFMIKIYNYKHHKMFENDYFKSFLSEVKPYLFLKENKDLILELYHDKKLMKKIEDVIIDLNNQSWYHERVTIDDYPENNRQIYTNIKEYLDQKYPNNKFHFLNIILHLKLFQLGINKYILILFHYYHYKWIHNKCLKFMDYLDILCNYMTCYTTLYSRLSDLYENLKLEERKLEEGKSATMIFFDKLVINDNDFKNKNYHYISKDVQFTSNVNASLLDTINESKIVILSLLVQTFITEKTNELNYLDFIMEPKNAEFFKVFTILAKKQEAEFNDDATLISKLIQNDLFMNYALKYGIKINEVQKLVNFYKYYSNSIQEEWFSTLGANLIRFDINPDLLTIDQLFTTGNLGLIMDRIKNSCFLNPDIINITKLINFLLSYDDGYFVFQLFLRKTRINFNMIGHYLHFYGKLKASKKRLEAIKDYIYEMKIFLSTVFDEAIQVRPDIDKINYYEFIVNLWSVFPKKIDIYDYLDLVYPQIHPPTYEEVQNVINPITYIYSLGGKIMNVELNFYKLSNFEFDAKKILFPLLEVSGFHMDCIDNFIERMSKYYIWNPDDNLFNVSHSKWIGKMKKDLMFQMYEII
jgi:hypothetical protein